MSHLYIPYAHSSPTEPHLPHLELVLQCLGPLCAISHHLSGILLKAGIRKGSLTPTGPPLPNTAYRRQPNDDENHCGDGHADCDFTAFGETFPALGGGQGRPF